jgi:hypothetical protein
MGKQFLDIGGRPTEIALEKSVDDVVMDFLLTCIAHNTVVMMDGDGWRWE